ncbi:cytochrome P450 [Pilatotrama ljubarskyi]|nr:cytochrome P450 [Pilatotrama ljubarskyi]
MPRFKPWLGFKDLCSDYGGIVHLNILGTHMVVIGSASVAVELLEKRSANTSDRPSSVTLPLVGNDVALSIMPYGQWWRDHRRAFWQVFHQDAVREYQDIQRVITRMFLKKLMDRPQEFKQHIRYIFAATMMKVLYGIDAKEEGDELISKIDEALSCTSDVATGSHPVDLFPFLRHIPGWVPGFGFQYTLANCKAAVTYIKEVPFARLKSALDEGRAAPCALSVLLSRISDPAGTAEFSYQEDVAKNVGLVAFEGGSDTSYGTLQGLFLAMSLYPDVLKKAQAELDAVVGRHRLPDFHDRDALVYVRAVIKEALRWHVVVPLGIPHRTVKDDVLDGYFIPAGTVIIPNTWAMLQDPDAYDQPEEFRPERFIRDGKLDPNVRDPYHIAFGFGRRACAGRHFAEDALYLAVASVLHVFDIEPPLDEEGRPIRIELRQAHGLLSYPEDCRCVVKPRSAEAAAMISESEARQGVI